MCIRSYSCICYYLEEFLVVKTCNRRTYETTIYKFLTVLYNIKKNVFFAERVPLFRRGPRPGPHGPMP